jgi:DNA-binding CsgD family transcriptional regulator
MQENLTLREQELLNLLLEGVSPKEISYRLHISNHTVDFHRGNLYRKLGINSLQELFSLYSESRLKSSNVEIMIPANTQRIPASKMDLLPYTDEDFAGGKSTMEVSINQETIDGVIIDEVLTLNATLAKGYGYPFAEAHVRGKYTLQQLRRADGIRFKAKGDGKKWRTMFHTVESAAANWESYQYTFDTVRDQTILVDIPYSSLRQSKMAAEHQRFEFYGTNIKVLAIGVVIRAQELGSFSIKIFDFEIYKK